MNADKLKSIVKNIVEDLEHQPLPVAGVDPDLVPFIYIGNAVAAEFPGLAHTVANWVRGNHPTAPEIDELIKSLTEEHDEPEPETPSGDQGSGLS